VPAARETFDVRENIFPHTQIGRAGAAKRLPFAAKEQKFVTGRVTNFVVLTRGDSAARVRRLTAAAAAKRPQEQ
jgi:hypothetical protein